jgi:hypothetical protein
MRAPCRILEPLRCPRAWHTFDYTEAAAGGARVPLAVLRELEPHDSEALEAALDRGVLIDLGVEIGFRQDRPSLP